MLRTQVPLKPVVRKSGLSAYGRDYFSIKGIPTLYEHNLKSFNFHSDPLFWEQNQARLYVDEGRRIQPSFCTGCNYLIFLGHPYHVRSFERIIDTKNDKWLVYVKKKAEEQKQKSNQRVDPTVKTPVESGNEQGTAGHP
ncbi:hypothetical protein [Pontiella desulfatans]|uniref:hypothetical protein n=1 Tax=Pontiella desulfatans TaxID=2750659 RepID=UPI00109D5698|nr:hypothetical protein [Pontiella desulfatans]